MKNKFLALGVAVCALGGGIPVAAVAATSHGSGGGPNYCSYYSHGVPGSKYCPGTGVPGVPSPPKTVKQAIIDVVTIADDATTITGVRDGHITTSFNAGYARALLQKLLKETKSPAARRVLENALRVLSGYEYEAGIAFGNGITFNSREVHRDVAVYGIPYGWGNGIGVSHRASGVRRIPFTYRVRGGQLSIRLRSASRGVKIVVNRGALKEPARDHRLKQLSYRVGFTTTGHHTAVFKVTKKS